MGSDRRDNGNRNGTLRIGEIEGYASDRARDLSRGDPRVRLRDNGSMELTDENDLSGYSEGAQKRIRDAQKKKVFLHTMKEPQNSSVAPMKPVAIKPGGRGPPTEEKRSPVTSRPTSNRVPSSVPTTLEGAFNFDGEGRNVHEILGILVEAQEKEAYAILGRTNVNRE